MLNNIDRYIRIFGWLELRRIRLNLVAIPVFISCIAISIMVTDYYEPEVIILLGLVILLLNFTYLLFELALLLCFYLHRFKRVGIRRAYALFRNIACIVGCGCIVQYFIASTML